MRLRTFLLSIMFLVGTATAGESKDSKTKPKPKPKAEEEEVLTFTTKDMERKYGKSPKPKPAPQPGAEPDANAETPEGKTAPQPARPDPLAQLQASEQAKRDKVVQRADAQRTVEAAQEEVAGLEKRLASLRNPLLARSAPSDEDEERDAWNGADQAGRVRMTEESLAAARDELAAASAELNKLR